MRPVGAWTARRLAIAGLVAFGLGGCAEVSTAPAGIPPASPPLSVRAAPDWRPGDRWVYGWSAGSDSGTKTVEVIGKREINKAVFYVVRVGDVDHLYTPELHWAASLRDQRVDSRMMPPEPWFVWPLEPGRRWDHQGTYEDRDGTKRGSETFSVVGAEPVEVPAGRFSALKIVRETADQDADTYWYAPEVRFYVKWIGRRGAFQFEEQLREYRPAPRPPGGDPPRAAPSPTR